MQQVTQPTPEPFRLEFTKPYETYINGKPVPVPYVVDGLMTQGGLSILAGKPKSGKSSISRYAATCVATGTPFLGRSTTCGDVMIVNLEDPQAHVDNCLAALGYKEAEGHGEIYITDRIGVSLAETISALKTALAEHPNTRLVIVDHLAKFLRVRDLNDYMPVQEGLRSLRDIARQFTSIHILALAHCKKVLSEDPFDQILGSTALRGEPDTNIVIYQQGGKTLITTETRVGRPIQSTLLQAETITSAGANVVSNFSLGSTGDECLSEQRVMAAVNADAEYASRVVEYLEGRPHREALQLVLLRAVKGKDERVLAAIKQLIVDGVITAKGAPRVLQLAVSEKVEPRTSLTQ